MTIGILFGDNGGTLLKVAAFGLVCRFFAAGLTVGLSGEVSSPPLKWPSSFYAELVAPSFTMLGLAFALSIVPYTLVSNLVERRVEAAERAAEKARTDAEARFEVEDDEAGDFEPFEPGETFLVGKTSRMIRSDEPPLIAKRIGGGYVKIYPVNGYLVSLPPGWRPGTPDPTERSDPSFDPVDAAEEQLREARETSALALLLDGKIEWSFQLGLAVLLFLFAFFYWPMAIAAAANGGFGKAFDPREVLPAAFRGGPRYVVIVALGFTFVVIPPLAAVKLGLAPGALVLASIAGIGSVTMHYGWVSAVNSGIALTVCMELLAVASCAQGYLLGRVLLETPTVFPELAE